MFLSLTYIRVLLDARAKRSIIYIITLTIVVMVSGSLIPFIFRAIVNQFELVHGNSLYIPLAVLLYGMLWTGNKLIMPLQFMLISKLSEQSIHTIMQNVFVHLHSLSLRFHLERKTGAIISSIGRAQTAFEVVLYGLFLSIIPTFLDFGCAFFILSYFYGFSYGLSFFIVVICSFGFSTLMLTKLEQQQKVYHDAQDAVRQKLLDSLLNFEIIKCFNNEQREYGQFDSLLQTQEQAGTKKHMTECILHLGQNILFGLCLAYVTWQSAHQVVDGVIRLGDFVLINSYLLRFITPLEYLGRATQQVKKSLVALKEIAQIFDYTPEVIDVPNAIDLKDESITICFQKVCFGYQTESRILSDLTFSIAQGKHVAIVGATGSGKSTITKLLLRLYDVNSGSITINGYDVRTLTQVSLRKMIGIVTQDVSLFHDTLYHNITYGCPYASLQEVECVMQLVQLDTFVQSLPDGYQTSIGERGLKLSGGEKQRLSIARALLKKASVYIFDESTSNLDVTTELIIQRRLSSFFAEKTTITIAHRLSNVVRADEILVLERGAIVERGTHKALLASQGQYYHLWKNQYGQAMQNQQ